MVNFHIAALHVFVIVQCWCGHRYNVVPQATVLTFFTFIPPTYRQHQLSISTTQSQLNES